MSMNRHKSRERFLGRRSVWRWAGREKAVTLDLLKRKYLACQAAAAGQKGSPPLKTSTTNTARNHSSPSLQSTNVNPSHR